MKEFIEKLIGRLEEQISEVIGWNHHKVNAYSNAIRIVNQLAEEYMRETPTVTNGWIPCSERLPEDSGRYLVTIKNATRATTLHYFEGSWHDGISHHYDVIAWMPLPEPFTPKEGRE